MIIKGVLILVSVFLLVYGYYNFKIVKPFLQKLFIIYSVVLITVLSYMSIRIEQDNYVHPKVWDFFCFFVNGNVAASDMNFYEPESYSKVINKITTPVKISAGYIEQELKVGFCYPPPSMFLFYPLSFFNYYTAHNIWVVIMGLLIIADIFLIYNMFFRKDGLISLLFIIPLFLLLTPVRTAICFEQTSFLLLLVLLLFWNDREIPRSGIWAAIGIFIKPLFAFVFLYYLLYRYWRSFIVAIVSTLVICLATIVKFSSETFFSYFTNNPNIKVPSTYYKDGIFQSLLSETVKITNYKIGDLSPFFNPIFIIGILSVIVITSITLYRLGREKTDWGIIILTLTALIIYPATQIHYSTILILPIIFLYLYLKKQQTNIIYTAIIIGTIYLLLQIDLTFIANLFTFIVLSIIGLKHYKNIKQSLNRI